MIFLDVLDVCNGVFQLYAVNAFLCVLDITLYASYLRSIGFSVLSIRLHVIEFVIYMWVDDLHCVFCATLCNSLFGCFLSIFLILLYCTMELL